MVKVTDERRFQVSFPRIQYHSPLLDNYQLAKQGLSTTFKKLMSSMILTMEHLIVG